MSKVTANAKLDFLQLQIIFTIGSQLIAGNLNVSRPDGVGWSMKSDNSSTNAVFSHIGYDVNSQA